jgi:plastocyanin
MRKLLLPLTVLAVVGAIFAVQALAATNVTWKIGTKKTISIKKGGTVKWVWGDGQPHNVKGPGFSSKVQSGKGKTYSHTFRAKGTYRIICQVHPTTMKLTVKVG